MNTRTTVKRGVQIAALLVIVVIGIVGYRAYKSETCMNENATRWQEHRLMECVIYYKDKTAASDSDDTTTLDGWIVVPGAEISTFEELQSGYARDGKGVFFRGIRVAGADPATFEPLARDWWKDNKHIYWRGVVAAQSDAATFDFFDDGQRFGRDDEREYFEGQLIGRVDDAFEADYLIAPYDGQELGRKSEQLIFWARATSSDVAPKDIAIALIQSDGHFEWITEGFVPDTGSYTWTVKDDAEELEPYELVFYRRLADGSVDKIAPPNAFTIADVEAPGLVLKINGSEEASQFINIGEVAYVTWASSGVTSCGLPGGGTIDRIGHAFVQFFAAGQPTDQALRYRIACTTDDNSSIERSILLRATPPTQDEE